MSKTLSQVLEEFVKLFEDFFELFEKALSFLNHWVSKNYWDPFSGPLQEGPPHFLKVSAGQELREAGARAENGDSTGAQMIGLGFRGLG